MTTTAMATYAYDQIDQARAELKAVSTLSALIRRPGGFAKSIVAWVTLTVPVCLATTRLVAPCR
jgi:hypothetical protein